MPLSKKNKFDCDKLIEAVCAAIMSAGGLVPKHFWPNRENDPRYYVWGGIKNVCGVDKKSKNSSLWYMVDNQLAPFVVEALQRMLKHPEMCIEDENGYYHYLDDIKMKVAQFKSQQESMSQVNSFASMGLEVTPA